MQRWIRTAAATFALLSIMATAAVAGTWNTNADGVVLNGYDVVAYHSEDAAVRGSAEFSARYQGGSFYFASAEHQKAFEADPERYAPQFGGYCAFGMGAKNAKVPVDPRTFKIHDGKLLVFFNDLYEGKPVNTKIFWNQQESDLYAKAQGNWKKLGE